MTRGDDGRYYATEEGAQKLEKLFRDQGIPVRVTVNQFKRFEVVHEDPNKEVVLTDR